MTQSRSGPATPGNLWKPPSAAELEARLPKFKILLFLGCDEFRAVYKGVQRTLGRVVAINVVPPEVRKTFGSRFSERFQNEIRRIESLNHPGIIRIFDFGNDTDGLLYIVTEYIEGTDVAKRIEREGRMQAETVRRISLRLCEILGHAHAHGVIHRDLKPTNLLLGQDGRIFVSDFGLAAAASEEGRGFNVTDEKKSPLYHLAPELQTGHATVDSRADLYSLGAAIYQMLTGRIPEGMPEPPSRVVADLDSRWDLIVFRATRERPEDRYSGADELAADLKALETPESSLRLIPIAPLENPRPSGEKVTPPSPPATSNPTDPVARIRTNLRRRTALASLGAVAFLAILLLAFLSWTPGEKGEMRWLADRSVILEVSPTNGSPPSTIEPGRATTVGALPPEPSTGTQPSPPSASTEDRAEPPPSAREVSTPQQWSGRHAELRISKDIGSPEAIRLYLQILDSSVDVLNEFVVSKPFVLNEGKVVIREYPGRTDPISGRLVHGAAFSSATGEIGIDRPLLAKTLVELGEEKSLLDHLHVPEQLALAYVQSIMEKLVPADPETRSGAWIQEGLTRALGRDATETAIERHGIQCDAIASDRERIARTLQAGKDFSESMWIERMSHGTEMPLLQGSRGPGMIDPVMALFLDLKGKLGRPFLKRFLTETLPRRPDAKTVQDAFDNVFVASFHAAPEAGLSSYFGENWKWPVSEAAKAAVAGPAIPAHPAPMAPTTTAPTTTAPTTTAPPLAVSGFISPEFIAILEKHYADLESSIEVLSANYRKAVEKLGSDPTGVRPAGGATAHPEVLRNLERFTDSLSEGELPIHERWLALPETFRLPPGSSSELANLHAIWLRETERIEGESIRHLAKSIYDYESGFRSQPNHPHRRAAAAYREYLVPAPGKTPGGDGPSGLIFVSVGPFVGDKPVRIRAGRLVDPVLGESKARLVPVDITGLPEGRHTILVSTEHHVPSVSSVQIRDGRVYPSGISADFEATHYAKIAYLAHKGTRLPSSGGNLATRSVWLALENCPEEFEGRFRFSKERNRDFRFALENEDEGGFGVYSSRETTLRAMTYLEKEVLDPVSIPLSASSDEPYVTFFAPTGVPGENFRGVIKVLDLAPVPAAGEEVIEIW